MCIRDRLWRVLKTQHTQPGKGGAYIQAELKEIREGTKMNSRFRSSEAIERAIYEMNTKKWNKKCYKARLRIKENFEIMQMIKSYNKS